MSNATAQRVYGDPPPTNYQRCPLCGYATIHSKSKEAEFVTLLERIEKNLKRWAARYAEAAHAKADQREAILLREAVLEYLLTR